MQEFKGVNIPTTGDDWQLYTCSMQCGTAARGLTAALKKAFKHFEKNMGRDGKPVAQTLGDAYKIVSEAMDYKGSLYDEVHMACFLNKYEVTLRSSIIPCSKRPIPMGKTVMFDRYDQPVDAAGIERIVENVITAAREGRLTNLGDHRTLGVLV